MGLRVFSKLSLRGFMVLLAGIVGFFWLVCFLFVTLRVGEMKRLIHKVSAYDRPMLEAGGKTLEEFYKVKSAFLMAFLTKDPAYLEAVKKHLSLTREQMGISRDLARKEGEESIIENLEKLEALIRRLEEKIAAGRTLILTSTVNLSPKLKEILNDLNRSENEVYKLASIMLEKRYRSLDEVLFKQDALGKKILYQNVILFVLSLVVAAVLIFWISGILKREVRNLLEVAERVGERDLRVSVSLPENSSNEIHLIGTALNRIIENIRDFLNRVREGIYHISSASEEFSAVVTQNVEHSRQAFENVRQLLDYTENLKRQINEITSSLDQLTEAVNEISKNATETSRESDHANQQVVVASEVLESLISEIENIRSSADLIQNIAEQTNLLALNATIEAARAGEAGKGFAVVANEVKELSKNSAESASQIRDRVQALVSRGKEMHINMKNLLESISRTRERTISVASAVEEQTAVISEVANTLNMISNEMDVLDKISGELKERTEMADSATEDMKQGAEELARTANLLQQEVNRYRI